MLVCEFRYIRYLNREVLRASTAYGVTSVKIMLGFGGCCKGWKCSFTCFTGAGFMVAGKVVGSEVWCWDRLAPEVDVAIPKSMLPYQRFDLGW